ncbi:MAG: matrixin family metalloprotease [Methanotrichaceae archaeon]|nr:matrixin family metalloprotease [Methanotrichaceae archaeon]
MAGWKYLSSAPNALAYSRTWYSLNKQGTPYYSALESDLSFNTKYGWSYSGKNYDIESVALHELGHTIGLGDLYGKPQYSGDTRQVMHYYTGIKRTLGSGDKNGAWVLYGR